MEKTKTPTGVPDLTRKEVENAKKDGALDAIKDGAKAGMSVDTGTTGDAEEDAERDRFRVSPSLNTTYIAPLLDLSIEDLTRRLKAKPAPNVESIDFETAKGLMALERAGKNRTGYVKALLAAIGADSPYDVTPSGPPYTNDETSVSSF